MLNSAVQRNGERVTAEEIRYVASELEDTLGGVYSILSQELQLPLVRRLLVQLEGTGQIPDLDGLVEPTITTGLAAIGRGHDFNKMMTFSQIVSQNPEMAQVINWTVMAERMANGLSINTENLIKTPEQIQQEQQQNQMAAMTEKAAPQMAAGMMEQANGNEGGT